MDGRIGKYFLNPSPGYGGSCFPKDTHALQYIGKNQDVNLNVVNAAIHANNQQIHYCFTQLKTLLNGSAQGNTVTILGTSFKPNTDDIRESASLKLIDLLLSDGAKIQFTDPKAIDNTMDLYGNKVTPFSSTYDAAENSDAIVLMTE
tara:strand:- start:312 stop:752 length:441 start_codon:yes stop_codon:yes gene_type:complete